LVDEILIRAISNLLLILLISSLIVLTTLKESQLNFNLRSFTFALKNKLVQVDIKKSSAIEKEDQFIDSSFNSEAEEEVPKQDIDLSYYEQQDNDNLLKLEDNIAKDKMIVLEEEKMEEEKIKSDISITIKKSSKSNFF